LNAQKYDFLSLIMQEIIYEYKDIHELGLQLFSLAKNRKIWLFFGEMGSGKTTLIKALAKILGSQDDFSSPSFGIINQYNIEPTDSLIYHIDFYRIQHEQELDHLGLSEILDSNNYVFIEWPEIAKHYLPENLFILNLEYMNEQSRKVVILEP
jgi:tRNA threonylcarbamoyladenosine biosynthesis protein TsaE